MNEEQNRRIREFEKQYERTAQEDGRWIRLAAVLLLLAIVLNAIGKAVNKPKDIPEEVIPEPFICTVCGTEMPDEIPEEEIYFCYHCGVAIKVNANEDSIH